MNQNIYIRNILTSFIGDRSDNSERIMFIKHFSVLGIECDKLVDYISEDNRKGLLCHAYRKNTLKSPYEPFLDAIKYYYKNFFSDEYTIEEFIDNSDIYSLHKSLFISYMKTGKAVRQEQIIPEEIQYEQRKMLDSILGCLNYIGERVSATIIIDKFQYANISTINFLSKILTSEERLNFKIIVIYNEQEQISSLVTDSFHRLIAYAEDKNVLFEWEGQGNNKSTDLGMSFLPDSRKMMEYLLKISNLYSMIAIEDAEYYIDIIYTRFEEEKIKIDDRLEFRLLFIRGMNYILLNTPKTALLICEKIVMAFDVINNLEIKYMYNYLCGMSHVYLIQNDMASKCADTCLEIAKQLNDEEKMFNAEILQLFNEYSGFHSIFTVEFQKVSIDPDMVKKLEKHKYYNILSYYYAYGADNDNESVSRFATGKKSDTYKKAVELGEKLKNRHFLLSIYTKYISIFTDKGFNKYVINFYKEKLKILESEKDLRRKSNLYQGLGYNAIINEQNEKASEYFNEAIILLYKLRKPESIAEALYNMAINCICVQDYLSASQYLNTMFRIMSNLGIETIQICNGSKLYGLMALAQYRMGNEYKCYMSISKVKILVGHLLNNNEETEYFRWHEDLFLYYFISGILEKNNGNLDVAYEHFKNAEVQFRAYIGSMFYCVVDFTIEYFDLLNKLGKKKEADELAEELINYCIEHGYIFKSKVITMSINNKKTPQKKISSPFSTVDEKMMIDLSYNISKEEQLNERKKDINFLSLWQEMLNRDDMEQETVIENAMTILQNNFNIDEILFLEKEKNKINELYKDGSIFVNGTDEKIFEYFENSKKEFYINRTNNVFYEYDNILKIFDKRHIVTLIGIPVMRENVIEGVFIGIVKMHNNFRRNKILFNDDNLVILKTAVLQLNIGLERIKNRKRIEKINKKLNDMAVRDLLTGLYNRQGFMHMIEEHKSTCTETTVLYMDLDNFKYCNDTFGHNVGDVVLVEFARVLNRITKDMGYAVRYGGDEFVVVLENANSNEGVKIAKKIYEEIEEGFVDAISDNLGKKVQIEKEKRVSTSIGIASVKCNDEKNILEALQRADTTLYSVKRSGKGKYKVFEEKN